jgi:eukaryotic-like serine/threonine-protein kinase
VSSGIIPLEEMRLGQTAVMNNLCTQSDLDEAIRRKRELSRAGSDKSIGIVLVDMGFITRFQLERLIELQKTADRDVTIIGNYKLLDKIGEGGMGAVYRAEEIKTGKIFALKVLQRDLARDQTFIDRFEQEIRMVFELNHPCIVRAYDVGHDGSNHYLVMEYVHGEDAYSILEKRGNLMEKEALKICRQVASALQHIHEAGLVHRDIKPENILVTSDGVAKLTDLGLAIKGEAKLRRRLTATGIAMGTPSYLSPEQIRGEQLDIRSDLYGLGATLYELVTGKVPFDGESSQDVMKRHLEDSVPSPRDVDHRISENLCHIVERLMAKDREHRYQYPFEVILDIDLALSTKPLATERVPRGRSTVRRPAKQETMDGDLISVKKPEDILRDAMRKHQVKASEYSAVSGFSLFLGKNARIVAVILIMWLILISAGIALLVFNLFFRK